MEGNADRDRKSTEVTGSGRKLKDTAADLHNLMLRWDKLNEQGSDMADRVVNCRLKQLDPSSSLLPPSHNAPLEDDCSQLLDVVNKMAAVVVKMERLLASQRGIVDLEHFRFGAEGRHSPLFHTWPTARFAEVSSQLVDSYRKELELKQRLLQELAHTATSDLCMVYLSCWLHQPYIRPQGRLQLEAMLLETGHRAL